MTTPHRLRFRSNVSWQSALFAAWVSGGCSAPDAGEEPIATLHAALTETTVSFREGTNGYAGTSDTQIAESAATTNYGNRTTLSATSNQRRTTRSDSYVLIRWDLSSVPMDATVSAVDLGFRVTDSSRVSYPVYALNRSWQESIATWNLAGTATSWQVAGARGSLDRGVTPMGTLSATRRGSATLSLTNDGVAVVSGWVADPSRNHGLIIASSSVTNDGVSLASSEHGTASYRPQITLTYSTDEGDGGTGGASGTGGSAGTGGASGTGGSASGGSPGVEPWTLIALPDTQYLAQSYPQIFTSQTQWIVNNRQALNIQMVVHEGDIVETWNSTTQWARANTSMSLLIDANIPVTMAPGDHDHQGQDPDGSTSYFDQTFPGSRFDGDSWWGGSYNGNTNHYVLLRIAGDDYIFIGLDFCPSSDEIEWANTIISRYANRKAILTTHALIDDNGAYNGTSDCSRYGGDTSFIWNDLIRHHDNLQLVLCGHMHLNDGERHQTVANNNGVPVHQVLADYQARSQGGAGRLRIMTFDPELDQIRVKTYSPYTNSYETDSDSEFTLPYEMGGSG